MKNCNYSNLVRCSLVVSSLSLLSSYAIADQVILDDLIVDGSSCIGFDCVNGESFGFDTLRLKENNLRIKFQDTSASASFPSNDWQLTANDSSNGGANKFSIDDITGGRTPFTVEANAPTNSLYVDDGGRIGLGTSTPIVNIHTVIGNTPTLRLEQNGSSGFTPQTWDVAGNEAGFFVRDASNGSTLPFRIAPGAPSSSIHIVADGKVGLGTTSPESDLDIQSTATEDAFIGMGFSPSTSSSFNIGYAGASFGRGAGFLNVRPDASAIGINPSIRIATSNITRMVVTKDGDVGIGITGVGVDVPSEALHVKGNIRVEGGSFIADATTLSVPDYVFETKYKLMPLANLKRFISNEKHLPGIKSAKEVKKEGLNISLTQMALLKKVEELTLYTINQQEELDSKDQTLDMQQKRLTKLEQLPAENDKLKQRLASLEKIVQELALVKND